MSEIRVEGLVREAHTERPLPGLSVRALFVDHGRAHPLHSIETGADGRFELSIHDERRPDSDALWIQVVDHEQHVLSVTAHPLRHGGEIVIDIAVKHPSPGPLQLHFLDAAGARRESFEIGEGLLVAARGLAPQRSHRVEIADEKDQHIASVSLIADRYGVVAPTVLWPDIGIGEASWKGIAFTTHEEAVAALGGRTLSLTFFDGKHEVARERVPLSADLKRPRLFSATERGAPQRGLLVGRDELRVQARNLPQAEAPLVDLYLVPRQADWHPGDRITPVRNPDGSEVVARLRLDGTRAFNHLLWRGDQLRPGSYDLIARPLIEHEFRGQERVFRATDLVSDRLITSIVVRRDIFLYKPIWLGCVMAMREMAGKKIGGSPYFEFTNNFPRGTDVWATLDPAGIMQGEIGRKVRYYVQAHKTPAQWAASSAVQDINNNDVEVIAAASCINMNEALIWSNPQTPGAYDVVADFGNNDPNPANFMSDGSFDPPLDMIDGYLNVGFYVTDDPSVAGPFFVGTTSYADPAVTIPAVGVWGPNNTIFGNTMSGTLSLPMNATIHYPADSAGAGVPVSVQQPKYPLVVVMHGMHGSGTPSYLGYDYLLDNLASNGFIAVSIDLNAINAMGGMQDTRGHAILEHLANLQAKNTNPGLFQGKIDLTKIGIMGHSRGGDGVVQAEIFNQALGLGFNIGAVVSLSPTDFSGIAPSPLVLATSNYLCIYGSNDGDVWGGDDPNDPQNIWNLYAGSGFRFYDRATVEKAMVFIFGATHNRFNTQWGTEGAVDTSSPKVLSVTDHHNLLCGYMTAFYQVHLQGRAEQRAYFTGEIKIPQASAVEVHTQYQAASGTRILDDYETNSSLTLSSSGGTVSFASLNGSPQEDKLITLDFHAPHQSKGVRLKWNNTNAVYTQQLLAGTNDVSGFGFLTFRVSQTVDSPDNPSGLLQDLYVRLNTGGAGPSRAVRAGYYGTIPYPYIPAYLGLSVDAGTKAALTTIRIPLSAWTIKALSAPIVDLTNIDSIVFELRANGTGDILIDDILFTT